MNSHVIVCIKTMLGVRSCRRLRTALVNSAWTSRLSSTEVAKDDDPPFFEVRKPVITNFSPIIKYAYGGYFLLSLWDKLKVAV